MTGKAQTAAMRSHEAEKLLERFLQNKKLASELKQKAYQNSVGGTIVIARHRETFMQARCMDTAVTYHHVGVASPSVIGIRGRVTYNAAMNLRALPARAHNRAITKSGNDSLDSVSAIRTERHILAVMGLGDPDMNELFAIVLAHNLGELTRDQLISLCIEGRNKWIIEAPKPGSSEKILDC